MAEPRTSPPAHAETEPALGVSAWTPRGLRARARVPLADLSLHAGHWLGQGCVPDPGPQHPSPLPPRTRIGLGSHLYRPRAQRGRQPKEAQQQQHQKADAPGPRPAEQRRPRHAAPASRAPDGRTGWQVRSEEAGRHSRGVLRLRTRRSRAPSRAPSSAALRRRSPGLWQPLHPVCPHGDAQGARWRAGAYAGGCHGSRRAVARAIDLAVDRPDRQGKLT